MNATQKVEALLADVLPRIQEIEEEALARVREVEEDAREKIARHEAARSELATVEAEIGDLEDEIDGLPTDLARADLEGDVELQDRLRGRYREAKSELEAAQSRRDELWQEVARLLPNRDPDKEPHRLDADIAHKGRVAEAAQKERAHLELLRDRLVGAANGAAEGVTDKHLQTKALIEQSLEVNRRWELGHAGHGAVRG